jgi:hypothetical protein
MHHSRAAKRGKKVDLFNYSTIDNTGTSVSKKNALRKIVE